MPSPHVLTTFPPLSLHHSATRSHIFTHSHKLVSLCLIGEARGNILAYHSVTNAKVEWPRGRLGVGMLSLSEREAGVPLADGLKSPEVPVWLVHGGDHFTVLFCCESSGVVGVQSQDAQAQSQPHAADETQSADVEHGSSGSSSGGGGDDDGDMRAQAPIVTMYHWNGLPPGGPRMAELNVEMVNGAVGPAPAKKQDTFYKPVPGQMEGVCACSCVPATH